MTPLYKRILGPAYDTLPSLVRDLHDVEDTTSYHGMCSAKRGQNILNRFLASLLSLPKTQHNIPLTVSFKPDGIGELWTRHFGSDRFVTYQWEKNGSLYERLRLVTLVFTVDATPQQLSLLLTKIYILGVPVPSFFRPIVRAVESTQNNRFHLDIDVHMPVTGHLISYSGWLEKTIPA